MSEASKESIDLLLIGKTGNGKSATGNSILRKPKTFKVMPTTQSVTKHIQSHSCMFNGRLVTIVDGPGVGDTRMSEEDALKLVQDRLQGAITANPNGYHAFLLVVRYGGRFTKEDIQTIDSLKGIFGRGFVKKYCILVVTCGDVFENDMEEYEMTFDQWLQDQEGVFKELLSECNRRVVLFNNKTKNETLQEDQVMRLVSLVDGLGGKRYNDEHFQRARRSQQRQMLEAMEPRIREETQEKLDYILGVSKRSAVCQPQMQIKLYQQLKIYAEIVLEGLQNEDKGTGVLKHLMDRLTSEIRHLSAQICNCRETIEEEKRLEQHRAEMKAEMEATLAKAAELQKVKLRDEKIRREQQRYLDRKRFERRQRKEREEMRLTEEMKRISLIDEHQRQERVEAANRSREERQALEQVHRRPALRRETNFSRARRGGHYDRKRR